MKTKEQILKWIDAQPWKAEFYEAVFKYGSANKISYDCCFISHAFSWYATEQGGTVWEKRSAEFKKWYYSNDRPMSWEKYCGQNPIKANEYYIIGDSVGQASSRGRCVGDANVMSERLCKAFLAYMKLIQLRDVWVKDYDASDYTVKIVAKYDDICKDSYIESVNGLSFPTPEMADEFIEIFRDLLEVAKPLI